MLVPNLLPVAIARKITPSDGKWAVRFLRNWISRKNIQTSGSKRDVSHAYTGVPEAQGGWTTPRAGAARRRGVRRFSAKGKLCAPRLRSEDAFLDYMPPRPRLGLMVQRPSNGARTSLETLAKRPTLRERPK